MNTDFKIPEASIIQWRRYIHANPELSFKEFKTSNFVAKKLKSFGGIEVDHPTKTSVVGTLNGKRTGKTIALRADMDALPIQEDTGVDFSSRNPGVAHACGHDAHTAMLLGTAKVLSGVTDKLAGTVKLIFQHAEELPPGGARELVKAGVLDGVDAIFGLHIKNQKAGTIRIPQGMATTISNRFYLTIKGRGSHGARPQDGIDPILVGSQIVIGLNTIPSRSIDPSHMTVVNVGAFNSGVAPNVIPETAKLGVSIRTRNRSDSEIIHRRCEEVIKGTCESYGAHYDIQWVPGYEMVYNDPVLVDLALKAASKAIGEENISIGPGSSGSEDFSAYTAIVPGCFMFLGGGDASDGLPYKNHSPKFNIIESTMANGTRVEAQIVLDMLGK